MVLTGADGQLKYQGSVVGKVRDWSITVTKDALEDTCLGDYDRSYTQGLRSTTGSATVLYDPGNAQAVVFLNSILNNSNMEESVEFVFNRLDNQSFKCKGFLTSVSPSVNVGEVQAVSVSFQVSGKPVGTF
jgi:hypothetical protein